MNTNINMNVSEVSANISRMNVSEMNTNINMNINTMNTNASEANANVSEMNVSEANNNDDTTMQQLIYKKYSYSVILFKNIHILYKKLNFIKHHIKKIADSYILV